MSRLPEILPDDFSDLDVDLNELNDEEMEILCNKYGGTVIVNMDYHDEFLVESVLVDVWLKILSTPALKVLLYLLRDQIKDESKKDCSEKAITKCCHITKTGMRKACKELAEYHFFDVRVEDGATIYRVAEEFPLKP